jgi:hypothetical protein
MATEKKLSTLEVLRMRYPATEAVVIQEVSDASGHARSRSLDFMVINLWVSRGLSIIGIEKKSNRGDWLKEIKNPKKQENHFKYCDRFYLLTDREGVAKLDEIPDCWGWYHITEKGQLKTMKQAPKLEPIQVERSFLCAMIRRAGDKTGYVPEINLKEIIQQRVDIEVRQKTNSIDAQVKELESLRKVVAEFEEAAGFSIVRPWGWGDSWPKKAGTMMRQMVNNGVESYIDRYEHMEASAKKLHESIAADVQRMKDLIEPLKSE